MLSLQVFLCFKIPSRNRLFLIRSGEKVASHDTVPAKVIVEKPQRDSDVKKCVIFASVVSIEPF